MRFAFTDDQLLFRDTVRDFLTKQCPPDQVRQAWTNESGRLPEVWRGLADMGVIGLTVPERHGGLGLGPLDLVLLMEETGRVALPEPIVETTAVAAPLLAEVAPDDLADHWLPQIAAGEAVVAMGTVGSPFVLGAGAADLLIVDCGDRLVALPAADALLTAQSSVDASRRLFTVDWAPTAEQVLVEGQAGWRAINAAFERGALAASAQLIGLADRMIEMTVDYVTERHQFGVPIGSFQAVKHHLADALLRLEFARPVVYRAAWAMQAGVETHPWQVSMAKAMASTAATTVARTALQCHGAIGYTVEYDLHLWMKRVWALAASWGDTAYHRNRVGVAVLGVGPPG